MISLDNWAVALIPGGGGPRNVAVAILGYDRNGSFVATSHTKSFDAEKSIATTDDNRQFNLLEPDPIRNCNGHQFGPEYLTKVIEKFNK